MVSILLIAIGSWCLQNNMGEILLQKVAIMSNIGNNVRTIIDKFRDLTNLTFDTKVPELAKAASIYACASM